MSQLDDTRIRKGIASFHKTEKRRALPQPRREFIPGERWEEKYDRLYRQMKPREQFGKTFSPRFDWRKSA